MTKMDRDGNNTVDFEEFYYWYEQEMEKKAVQLTMQLKMSEFEAEANARAETIQELQSNLFEAQQKADQAQKDAEARIAEVRRTAEAALFGLESEMQRGSDEDSDWKPGELGSRPDTAASDTSELPAIGGEALPSTAGSRTSGNTSRGWSAVLHGEEIDPDAAASKAAAKMQKKMALRARQAEQKAELAKVCLIVRSCFTAWER